MKKLSTSRAWVAVGVACGAAVAATGVARAGVVAPSLSGPDGQVYTVVYDPTVSWNSAEAAASQRGAALAIISSPSEQRLIQRLLLQSSAPTGSYWFGLHETGTEGQYVEVTGAPQRYTHWLAGQPDNGGGAGEDSGAILWSTNGNTAGRRGFWNDLPNVNTFGTTDAPDLRPAGYIVEYNLKGKAFAAGGTGTGNGSATGGSGGSASGGTGTGGTITPPAVTPPPVVIPPTTGGGSGSVGGVGGTTGGSTGSGSASGSGSGSTSGSGSAGGSNGGTSGTGSSTGTGTGTGTGGTGGETGGTGSGGGRPASVPLPAAVYVFPLGATLVGFATRRMRKRQRR